MTTAPGQGDLRLDNSESPNPDEFQFLFGDPDASPHLGQDLDKPAVLEVVQIWESAVLGVHHLHADDAPLTLGDADCTFTAPNEDLPGHNLALFRPQADGFVLRACAGWTGFVQHDATGERRCLQALRERGEARAVDQDLLDISVPVGHSIWVDTGHVLFGARHVPPSKAVVGAHKQTVDAPFLGVLSMTSVLGTLLGIAIALAPPPAEAVVADIPDRFAEVILETPAPPPAPKVAKAPERSNRAEGAKAKKEEGRKGSKTSKMKVARGDVVKRELDNQVASTAGLLGALNDDAGLDAMLGENAISAGMLGGLGGAIGAKGVQLGYGGLGSDGRGLGGGGQARGIGGLGTQGRGGGDGNYGASGGSFERGEGGDIATLMGDVITLGALDKSLIDQVIKRHISSLRYCYQRQLTRHPGLAGKVVVKFVIAGDGSVSKAMIKRSSLGNSAVESCMTNQFLKMKFPAPKGNGIVMVSYPFLFQAN